MTANRRKFSLAQCLLVIVVLFFLVLTLFPIYIMLVKSFK